MEGGGGIGQRWERGRGKRREGEEERRGGTCSKLLSLVRVDQSWAYYILIIGN